MTEAQFAKTTSAENFVAVRNRPGGPAPGALADAIKSYRLSLTELSKAAAGRATRHSTADAELGAAFNSLLES